MPFTEIKKKSEIKKKWGNYWYYYKWHTYAGIFVLIVMLVTITQCASNVKPDNTIMLISKTSPLPQEVSTLIKNDLAKYVIDINKDGKKTLDFLSLDFSSSNPQMFQAAQVKLMGELQTADSFIFLIDNGAYKDYIKDGFFDKIKGIIPNAPIIDDYRIPVSNLNVFKDKSYKEYLKNYYFAIRIYKGSAADNSTNLPAYKNDIEFLKRLIA
jgi:hypothetical protein